MLIGVGEAVILVQVEGAGDYANCSAILDTITRRVLAKGFEFNSETLEYVPDESGEIAVPPEVMSIDATDKRRRIVQRGTRLYDKETHSFTFDKNLEVDVILYLPFEDCPEHVQNKIVADAAAKYQRSYVGSVNLDQFAQQERAEVGSDTADAEFEVDDFNILDNPDLRYLHRGRYTNGSI